MRDIVCCICCLNTCKNITLYVRGQIPYPLGRKPCRLGHALICTFSQCIPDLFCTMSDTYIAFDRVVSEKTYLMIPVIVVG